MGLKFTHYDDPIRAEGTYKAYISNRISERIIEDAKELVKECKTAEDLDIALDRITSGHKSVHFADGNWFSPGILDDDGTGYRGLAVRALEDCR